MLSDSPTTVMVQILGTSIAVKTLQPEDKIRNIAEYVEARMRDVAERSQVISSLKIAIMSAMQIASELPQFQPGFASQEMEDRLIHLVECMELTLAEVNGDQFRQGNETSEGFETGPR